MILHYVTYWIVRIIYKDNQIFSLIYIVRNMISRIMNLLSASEFVFYEPDSKTLSLNRLC